MNHSQTGNFNFEPDNLSIPSTHKKRIVIIGGGFAGINFVEKINTKLYQVVLFDRYNYHTFQPLLYQVATAGLEPDSICGPLRKVCKSKKDLYFRMLKVQRVDTKEKRVHTLLGSLEYDYLIIATGAKTNYFGNDNIEKHAFPLKQVVHALELRSQLFQLFEKAELRRGTDEVDRLLTFVIVGGGPTGVEMAGALAEMKKHVLPHDYPEIDFTKMKVYLLEGVDRLLPAMSESSSESSRKYLESMGVDVRLNTFMKDYDGRTVVLDNGEEILTDTVVWAAGVKSNIIDGIDADLNKGRFHVDEYNRVYAPGNQSVYENIYALGDVAFQFSEQYPNGLPGVAPVAIQQGDYLGKSFNRIAKNKEVRPFNYLDKGTMATVGRNKAVADLPLNIRFSGFIGWVTWMFVHLMYLIGFRNKLVVFVNWLWSYLNYDRGIRLIIRPAQKNWEETDELIEKSLQ
ncbi:NAD(P)/FAD-dependent oxidoreductase [Marinigracilibium pacificum]|uniref:NADH:ubiquinone reductase (non-electrogenic) n=1 Tax=Marinigracilibium pacificum TaxID=2729599 RepID=A0A848J0B3_9BACT|nr:NAD(P)/FAD-dependent oxidoreductase [Marinigracilibium pacificum]NMM47990.1 NAD(P)/FAD-dependent oxidoreductase [Marinigracilibium pacificum]